MSRVFVSYRRADTQGSAGRLHQSLLDYFGGDQVFMDVNGLVPGELWSERLFAELGESDVLVVVIGPRWLTVNDQQGRRLDDPNDVVRREIELAFSRDKIVVPVLVEGASLPEESQLPPSLVGLRAHQAFVLFPERWNDDMKLLITHLEEVTKYKYRRGFWRSDVADASMWVGDETLRFKAAIEKCIENRQVLDPMYYYVASTSFQNWMNLTREPGYKYYQAAIDFYERCAGDIADAILAQTPNRHVDFVSLGPGDGKKDRMLIRAFFEASCVPPVSSLYYYPYDINSQMITQSLKEIGEDAGIPRNRLRVKAIVSSFRVLTTFVPLYRDYRDGPNVLSFLGNTLGNMPQDRDFLEYLHRHAMASGDFLLLEVKRRVDFASRVDKARLADELRNRFTIGPLEVLGTQYDPENLERKVEERRSQVPKSQTLCSYYRGLRYKGETLREPFLLSYIHEYDEAELIREARDIGFDVVKDWPDESEAIILLMRKR